MSVPFLKGIAVLNRLCLSAFAFILVSACLSVLLLLIHSTLAIREFTGRDICGLRQIIAPHTPPQGPIQSPSLNQQASKNDHLGISSQKYLTFSKSSFVVNILSNFLAPLVKRRGSTSFLPVMPLWLAAELSKTIFCVLKPLHFLGTASKWNMRRFK